jgi:hypothetical protein
MRRLTSSFSTVRVLGSSALIAAAMALPAAAQPANAPAAAAAQTQPAPGASATGAAHSTPMQQREQQRLTQLHQHLRITPTEQSAWDQFAEASMQNATRLDTAFRARAEQVPTMNAIQNMQTFADLDMQRAQDMQQLVPAFQKLYAALSPAQQKTADQLFRDVSERAQARAQARTQKRH